MKPGVRKTLAIFSLAACGCAPTATDAPAVAKVNSITATSTLDSPKIESDPTVELPKTPAVLKRRIEAAIENVRLRDLSTDSAFWTVFHGILGLGPGLTLKTPTGIKVNALDYVFGGDFRHGEIRGMRFIPTRNGVDVQTGPVFDGQGHQDQFIAEVAQWGVPVDRKVVVLGRDYTIRDFLGETKAHSRVNSNQELSWAIVVVAQYDTAGTRAEWTNAFGEKLKYADLIRYELDQNIEEAACGGTHRLFGLTWALHHHLRTGGKREGVWKEIADKNDRYRDQARKQQNSDGSFSSNYFRGPSRSENVKERLGAAGHILEWLAISLKDSELREQWMQDAANAVAMMFLEIQAQPMESGALYHAIHGLIIYHHRVFGKPAFAGSEASDMKLHKTGATDAVKHPSPPPTARAAPSSNRQVGDGGR